VIERVVEFVPMTPPQGKTSRRRFLLGEGRVLMDVDAW